MKGLRLLIVGLMVSFLIIVYSMNTIKRKTRLNDCSFFTVAKVSEVKYRKGHAWIVYDFKHLGKKIERDDPANPWNTGDWWKSDVKALSNRRFWVQVNCEDPKWHKLLWNLAVPDTLENIPVNGWKVLPHGLRPYAEPVGN